MVLSLVLALATIKFLRELFDLDEPAEDWLDNLEITIFILGFTLAITVLVLGLGLALIM
jgi:hypothetical protein